MSDPSWEAFVIFCACQLIEMSFIKVVTAGINTFQNLIFV